MSVRIIIIERVLLRICIKLKSKIKKLKNYVHLIIERVPLRMVFFPCISIKKRKQLSSVLFIEAVLCHLFFCASHRTISLVGWGRVFFFNSGRLSFQPN